MGITAVAPTIMATDPSAPAVMAVLDTTIHALRFMSWRRHEPQTGLLGITAVNLAKSCSRMYIPIGYIGVDNARADFAFFV
jgi:hypothetical protein